MATRVSLTFVLAVAGAMAANAAFAGIRLAVDDHENDMCDGEVSSM